MTVAVSGSTAVFEHYTGRRWSEATADRVAGANEPRRRRVVAELQGVLNRHESAGTGVGASLLCYAAHPGESETKGAALERRLASARALETLAPREDAITPERLSVVLDVLDATVHRPRGAAWRMSSRHDTDLSMVRSLCRVVNSCIRDAPAVVASRVDVFVDVLSLDASVHLDGLRVLWALADVEPDALEGALDALVAYLDRGGWEFTPAALVLADVADTYPERVSDSAAHLVRAMRQEHEPFSIVATQVTGHAQFGAIASSDRRPQKVFAAAMVAVAEHDPTALVDHLDVLVSLVKDTTSDEARLHERTVASVAVETPTSFNRAHVDTLESELDEFATGVGVVMALAAILRATDEPPAVDPSVVDALASRLDADREEWTFWSLLVLGEYVDTAPSVAGTVASATASLLRTVAGREQRVATELLLKCANADPESVSEHVPNVKYVACSAPEETAAVAVSVLRATLRAADADADALVARVLEALLAVSHDRSRGLTACRPLLAEHARTAPPAVSGTAMHALAHSIAADPDAVSTTTATEVQRVVADGSRETRLWGCRALVSLVAARPSLVNLQGDTVTALCAASDPFQQFTGAQLAYETDRLHVVADSNSRVCERLDALLSAADDAVREQAERMLAVDEPFFDREAARTLFEATPQLSSNTGQLVELLALTAPDHLAIADGVDELDEIVTGTLTAETVVESDDAAADTDSGTDGTAISERTVENVRNAAYVLTTIAHRSDLTPTGWESFAALRGTDRLDLQGLGALGALARNRAGTVRGQALCHQLSVLFDVPDEAVHECALAVLDDLNAGRDEASVVETRVPRLASALPADERDLALRVLVQLCRYPTASALQRIRSTIRTSVLAGSDAGVPHETEVRGLSNRLLALAIDPSIVAPPDGLVESVRTVLTSGTPNARTELLQTLAVAARLAPDVVDAVADALAGLEHPSSRAMATEVLAAVARTTGRVPVHPAWVNQLVYSEHPDVRHAAALVNAHSPEPARRVDVSTLLENMAGGSDAVLATVGLGRGAAAARELSSAIADRRRTLEAALARSPTDEERALVVRLLESPQPVVRVHTYRVLRAVLDGASLPRVVDAIDALAAADPQSPPADGYVAALASFVHSTSALAGTAGVVVTDLVAADEATHGPENPAGLVLAALLEAHPVPATGALDLEPLPPAQFLKLIDVLHGTRLDPDDARGIVRALVEHGAGDAREDEAGTEWVAGGSDDDELVAGTRDDGRGSATVRKRALVLVLESHLVAANDDGDADEHARERSPDWGRRVESRVASLVDVLESPGESEYVRSTAMEQWLPVPLLPALQAVSAAASIAPAHAIGATPAIVDRLDHHAGIVEFTGTGVLRAFTSHDASRALDLAPDLTEALATRLTETDSAQTASDAAHALGHLVADVDDPGVAATTVRAFATALEDSDRRVLPGLAHGFGFLQRATDADMTALVGPVVDRLLEPPAAATEPALTAVRGSRQDGPSDKVVAAFRSLARQEPAAVVDAIRVDDGTLPTVQSTNATEYLMGALGALGAHSPAVLDDLDAHARLERGVDTDTEMVVQEAAHAVHEIVRAHPSVAPSFEDYFATVLASGSPFEHFEALATLYELVAQDAQHVFASLDALRPVVERQLVAEYAGSRYAAVRLLQDGYAQVDALSATSDAVDRYLTVFEAGHSRAGTGHTSMVNVPDSADVPVQNALLGVHSFHWPAVDLGDLLPDGTKYATDPTLNRSHETMIRVHLSVLAGVADLFETALDLSDPVVGPHVERALALADDAIHQHRQLLGVRLLAVFARTAPDALTDHVDELYALLGRVPDSPLASELRCTLVDAFTDLPAATTATSDTWT